MPAEMPRVPSVLLRQAHVAHEGEARGFEIGADRHVVARGRRRPGRRSAPCRCTSAGRSSDPVVVCRVTWRECSIPPPWHIPSSPRTTTSSAPSSAASSREKVKPHGPKWEEAGFVAREVLREMGELGFFSPARARGDGRRGPRCARLGRAGRGGRPLDRMAALPSPCWCAPTWRARISCASAPSASSRSTCRASWRGRSSRRSASPSPPPAPTLPVSAPARCAMATTMC